MKKVVRLWDGVTVSMIELPPDFLHEAPKNYEYEVRQHKRNLLSIWLVHPDVYTFTDNRVSTIWGFYDSKKRCYCSPINSTKCGDPVNFNDTTPYSAMIPNINPLMAAFS